MRLYAILRKGLFFMKLQRKGIFHLYFRDIFLVIAPLLFLLYVNYHHIRYLQLLDDPHNPLGHLSLLRDTFQVSIYCFIFFAFISYYFLEKARGASLLECLSVVENGRLNTYGAQILFLTVLDLDRKSVV